MAVRPVPHAITQPFAANPTRGNPHPVYGDYQPGGHSGADFGCPPNTPVAAPEDMVITWANWGSKFPTARDNSHAGLAARYYLNGDNLGIGVIGETGHGAYALYHLNSTHLNPGDRVKAGDLIGYSGSTGLSSGPHLHVDWIPAPANYATGLYGRADPIRRFTEAYRINGHRVSTAATKAKAKVRPVAKPKPKGTTLDRTPVTDINGNVRHLKDVLDFRFARLYEQDAAAVARLEKLEREMEKITDGR